MSDTFKAVLLALLLIGVPVVGWSGYQYYYMNSLVVSGDINLTGDIVATGTISAGGTIDTDKAICTGDGTTQDLQILQRYLVGYTVDMRYLDDILNYSLFGLNLRGGLVETNNLAGNSVHYAWGMQTNGAAYLYTITHTNGGGAAPNINDAGMYFGYAADMTDYSSGMQIFGFNADLSESDLDITFTTDGNPAGYNPMSIECSDTGIGSCSDVVVREQLSVTADDGDTLVLLNGLTAITVNPGSDTNVTIIDVNVTGAPYFKWVEAGDYFEIGKGLNMASGVLIGTTLRPYDIEAISAQHLQSWINSASTGYWQEFQWLDSDGDQMLAVRHGNTIADAGVFLEMRAVGADPCNGNTDYGIYMSTAGYPCYCDGAGVDKKMSDNSACAY